MTPPSAHGITLAEAQRLLESGATFAKQQGFRMALAVVDRGGHPVGMLRMDGASILAGESVIQKARTAVWLGRPTATAVDIGKEWPHVYLSFAVASQGAITLSKGGIPIQRDGQVLGAIGSAGGSGEQDAQVSLAALQAQGYETDPATWPESPAEPPAR